MKFCCQIVATTSQNRNFYGSTAGKVPLRNYSHSLNPEKPKALQYQGFRLFLFLLFRIMFRRIEAFLKFPKTNRNQVKLFFFVNPCSLTFALGAEGWRLCVVALQTMISKSELKRLKVGMPLKGSKMPYNRFYTRLRVEIPPKSKTPLKTPLNALCGVCPILRWRKRRRRLCVVSYKQKENHPCSVLQEKGWWQQGSAKRQRHFLLKHLIYSANYFLYLLCCFIFN